MLSLTYFCLLATVSSSFAAAVATPAAAAPAAKAAPAVPAVDVLPEKFYGTFDLDHSENFDEYLTAKGYSWFTRKIVTFATFKKVFAKTSDKTKFDYSNLTSKKDIHYKNVVLGKSFEGEGLDSTKFQITFSLKDGHVFEHQKPLEGGDAKEETYEYLFDGDFLLVRMTYDGVEGRRFYKRIA